MKAAVFIDSHHRLWTGWRLLVFVLSFGLLNLVASAVRRFVFASPPLESTTGTVLFGTLLLITATVAVFVCRRFLDKKSFRSLGLHLETNSVRDFIFGFCVSGLMVASVYMALWAFGWLAPQGINGTDNPLTASLQLLLLFVGVGVTIGWWEEIVFRGYVLQNLIAGLGLKWAIGLSCLLYGVIHLLNPNANLLSALVIAAIGYLRIFGWLCTRQLWLSIGTHCGWNFLQGPVFGFSVSGRSTYTLLQHTITGPSWLTGGDFGLEGGLVTAIVVVIGIAGIWVWTRHRDLRLDSA